LNQPRESLTAVFLPDNRYLGQITSDSSIQRQAERDELKEQLNEPDKGGLTTSEEKQCKEAFARHQTLPKTYGAVWEDKQKRLEAHVIMHTARARAFQARDPALLKAESEQEQLETPDHSVNAPDSPIHNPAYGTTTNDPQPHPTIVTVPGVHPNSAKEDGLIAGKKKDCDEVGAQSSDSDGYSHGETPSMTGSKGSRTIIDLTDAGDESRDTDVPRSVKAAPNKRVEPLTKHKPTQTNAVSPFAPKGQRREAPPTKRHKADGAEDGENKPRKRGVSQASPLNGRHR